MENSISSDLIRGHIDTIILYSLIDGAKHVQQIIDCVYEKSEKQYELNQATLYSSLKRLEKEKLLNAFWNDSENGRRRFFSITDAGKKFIDANLSNWSFSRSIIDKLLGVESEQIEKNPQNLVVQEPINEINEENKKTNSIDNLLINKDQFDAFAKQIIEEKPEIKDVSEEKKILEKEINFRNILNGIIKATAIVEKSIPEPIPAEKTPKNEKNLPKGKEKLQEVIEKQQNSQRISKCNIDFSDLEIKASKEGYKIRFSNISYKSKKGNVYINKLNMFSSFFLSFIMALEFLIITLTSYSLLNFTVFKVILGCIICVLPTIIFSIIYLLKPKMLSKSPKTNGIISFLIVIFDILVLLFVIEWIIGVDFTILFNLISYFLIPSLILLDVLFYLLIRKLLSNKKYFNN